MQYSLAWTSDENLFVAAIVTVAASFLCYYFISESKAFKNEMFSNMSKRKSQIYSVYAQRLLGVLFFGIIPFFIVTIFSKRGVEFYGVNFHNFQISAYWILGLSPLLLIMNYFNSKKADNLQLYPQIRAKDWNINTLITSALTWILYLAAYEFMFRGFLMFVCLQYLGVWSAIALNLAIYSLVHVPKGIKEAVGALPLGLVLGIITVQTSSILVAFVVHIVLALSNEWFSLKAHSDISLKINKLN